MVGCHISTDSDDNKNDETDTPEQKETGMNDTTPKVTGIGGVFFRSTNPQEIRKWYGKS